MASPRTSKQSKPAAALKFGGVGSEAVAKATGRTWAEWLALLDAERATELPHREIATRLYTKHGVGAWWAQMITVGYEQARGRRVAGQKCDGNFAANGSKTLPLAATAAHTFFTDARKRRRWLPEGVVLRTATPPKSARLEFPDGSIAGAWLTAKGADKCSVGISHDGLPDAAAAAKYKAVWKTALETLAGIATPR